jgi:hypothetical protein
MPKPGENIGTVPTFPHGAEMLWSRVAEALRPPPLLPLSERIEQTIRLPHGLAAEGGPLHLWLTCEPLTMALCKRSRPHASKEEGDESRSCYHGYFGGYLHTSFYTAGADGNAGGARPDIPIAAC